MSATQAATSAAVGGSECRCRSCSRTEPMSIESAASGAAAPRISSVEPPPMSTTSTGVAGRRRRLRTAPSKDSAASSSPRHDLGLDAEPRPDPGDELVGVRGVPGGRGRHEPHPIRRHAVRPDQRGVLVDRGERPLQRLVGEPAGAVDVLAEPHHPHLADVDVRQRPDQQLDGVGAAVDRGDPRRHTQGPDSHHSPSRSSTSSPSGFTPRPWASDWPASTCRHFTRSGMPPAEMPSISGTLCRARRRGREVALVRGAVRRGQLGVLAEPVLHLLHQARALEGADPRGRARAGQVVRRRERRAVGQPRLGGDDVGVAARAAVADLVDGPRLAAELGVDGGDVVRVDHASSSQAVVSSRTHVLAHHRAVSRRCPRRSWSAGCCLSSASAGCRRARPTPRPSSHHAVGGFAATVVGSVSSASLLERLAVLVEHDVRRLARHHVVEARAPAGARTPGRPSAASRARGR